MTFEKFKSEQYKVFIQNQKLTIALVVMMVVNLILGVYILTFATNSRTVFLPSFNATQEFWVAGREVSVSYLEQIGRYISDVLWNVSPDNAKSVKGAIMPLVPSQHWNDVDRAITQQLAYIADNAITRVFLPSSIDYASERGVLYVKGALKEMTGDVVALNKTTTLRIQYKIENGRFWLLGVAETDRRSQ
jgi:conjugal transfer pilus assembly protein TraE